MTAWGHLPNAVHIDRVLVDLNKHPADFDSAWSAAQDAVRGNAWATAVVAVSSAARYSAKSSAWSAARDSVRDAGWSAARDAILALVAYDHADEYMTMLPRQALVWGELRGDIAYVLLRPYLRTLVKIAKTQQVDA